ncbi:MAG: ABC transporter substrate-binding protein [Rhodoferax sp.]
MAITGLNRRVFTSALVVLASAASPTLRAQPRLEKTRLLISVAVRTRLGFLPLILAQQLGYFRDQGLEVEIGDFEAGAADVVSGTYQQVISLHSKGQRFQSFVLQGRAPAISIGVSTRTLPRYQSLLSLGGRKIGVSALGSASHMVARAVLRRANLKDEDLNFVAIGNGTAALAALRSGQVDAISNADPVMTMLEQKGDIHMVADTRTLKGTADLFGGPMPTDCLYAATEFVERSPNTVQALANAMVHSLKWLQTAGPADIIKTVPENHFMGDRALYLAAFNNMREAISPDGMMPDDGPRTVLKALASFDAGVKADRIELNRTYSNEFAKRAKDPLQARRSSA